jgi:hypothetical protein
LLSPADFELAASKNITIELITTNYVEDRRLSEISNKADKTYVDEKVADLVGSAPETLDTISELATALQENNEVVQILNDAIVTKAHKTYANELIANIPVESDVVIVDCPDGSVISHTFEQVKTAINNNKVVYASVYGLIKMSLAYVADDDSFIEFRTGYSTDQIYSLKINNDNTFIIETIKMLPDEPEYSSIILKSSTSGSTKKFKLTIDDDGVLSTEEVIE